MEAPHLTTIERRKHSTFRASCLCGWEETFHERLVSDARQLAQGAAWKHWAVMPVVTDAVGGEAV